MSVIIRLQNLPWSANALDIRQYFRGLSIPEGGVHIVGGELGDAFIAFSTDEDARQAFNRNNGKIKEVQIKLMLSSRSEMTKVIEAAKNQSLVAFMQSPPLTSVAHLPVGPSTVGGDVRKNDCDRDRYNNGRNSRSSSRERKDRSRDGNDRRDRYRGRRSRSRSRDRRNDRRRRERSRSRDRTRSNERVVVDRADRNRERRRNSNECDKDGNKQVGVWEYPKNLQQQLTTINLTSALSSLPALPLLAANLQQNRNAWPLSLLATGGHNENLKQVATSLLSRLNPQPQPSPKSNYPYHQQEQQQQDKFNARNELYGNGNNSNDSQQQQIEFRNCCVRLRPYFGGYGEIRRFFQGIFIHNTGIKFVNDEDGKRTGIVYVRFAYPEGKEQALQRNGATLKNQICEVVHLDDEEFEGAVDRFQPDLQENSQDSQESQQSCTNNKNHNHNGSSSGRLPSNCTCLTVEDLPSFVKEHDILRMFGDYSLMSIFVVNKPRKNVVAYVKFGCPEDARKAYENTSKHTIDGKEVTVKPCRDEQFAQVSREQNELLDSAEKKSFVEADSNCVLLSGLPLKTNDRDITDIFSDVGIIPDNIHLINGPMGFTGEAFCEFCSLEDAQISLEKDGMQLGASTVISVKCVPKTEMEAILGIRSQQHNLPPKTSNNSSQRQAPYYHQQRNNYSNNAQRVPPSLFASLRLPPAQQQPQQQQSMRRFPPPMQMGSNDMMLGPPGCTVLMENVPYKAGLDEILDFFADFEILPDNILRKFNQNGKPSGETKVIFCNADDAYQAVQRRNRHKIRDRTIYLSLC